MPKKIIILGGSGFIAQELGKLLTKNNYEVIVYTRNIDNTYLSFPAKIRLWNGKELNDDLSDIYGVINLCGEGVFNKPWSKKFIQSLYDSRLEPTKALVKALKRNPSIKVVINASAIGYYSSNNSEVDEYSLPGNGILADICKKWEQEAFAMSLTTRLVTTRFGVVLGLLGGAFSSLLDLYATGLGACIGNGKNAGNYIHLEDVVRFLVYALENEEISGTYNLVGPNNTNQQDFHQQLCKYTRSFSWMKIPSLAASLILGKRASMLTENCLVTSSKISKTNFKFKFNNTQTMLEDLFSHRIHKNKHFFGSCIYLNINQEEMWDFMSNEKNLEQITPSWLNFKVLHKTHEHLQKGSIITYKLSLKGIPISWQSLISDWKENKFFADTQIKGPYGLWYHQHLFVPLQNGMLMYDYIDYDVPLWPFGEIGLWMIKKDLKKIFNFRSKILTQKFNQKLFSHV